MKEHNVRIPIRQKWIEKSTLYKDGMLYKYYKEKRDVDEKKAQMDHFWGKISEFAVAQFLYERYGYPLVEPDLRIFEIPEKSWRADLYYDGQNDNNLLTDTHVKNCPYEYRQGCSWIIQKTDHILTGNYDHEALALVHTVKNTCIIKMFLLIKEMHQFLSYPFMRKHIEKKRAIYLRDLERYLCK